MRLLINLKKLNKNLLKARNAISVAFVFILFAVSALGVTNQNLIYQGRIVRPDGTVPNTGTITFTVSVYSPSPSQCLLYSETHTVNMTGSQGMFSLTLGAGTRTDGGAHVFNKVFVNGGTLTGLTCASGTSYAAGATDDRSLITSFLDAGQTITLSAVPIKSVPFALQAHEVDGWGLNNLVKVSSVGSPTTFTTTEMANAKALTGAACALNEILKWNGTAWACASDATGGSPVDASFLAKGIVQGDTDAATSGLTFTAGVIKVNSGTAANQIVKLDASAKLPGVDGSALTSLDPTHLSAAVPINKGGTGQITAILGFNALSPITTKGDLITSDGTNNVRLPAGTNGFVLMADSAQSAGVKWAAIPSGTVTSVSSANADIAVATGTSTPVLTLNSGTGANQIVKLDGSAKLPAVDGSALTNLDPSQLSGAVAITKGGTGQTTKTAGFDALSPLTTKGDLLSFNGTNNIRVPAGTDGYVLQADSAQSSGVKWAAVGNVSGTGTANAIPKFTGTGTIGNSAITDNGTVITATRAILSTTNPIATGAAVDLSTSNSHTLASVGGSAITLTNMQDGGVYNIVIEDTTSRTYTFSGCTNSYFRPVNTATSPGTRTVYGVMTVKKGANWDCYISWSSGFQ